MDTIKSRKLKVFGNPKRHDSIKDRRPQFSGATIPRSVQGTA